MFQVFTKALVPKPIADGANKNVPPEMEEAEIKLTELLIELPKVHVRCVFLYMSELLLTFYWHFLLLIYLYTLDLVSVGNCVKIKLCVISMYRVTHQNQNKTQFTEIITT